MKFINCFVVLVFMVGFASSGISICVDLIPPSAPENLIVSGEVGNILVSWDVVIDEPVCGGVDYYNVSRDGVWIGTTEDLSFVDVAVLGAGDYDYTVYAVDLVGGNAGASIKNSVVVDSGGSVGGSGSSSTSYICTPVWECGNWSECVGNEMRRICLDSHECGSDYLKPETYLECGVKDFEDDLKEGQILESSDADVEEDLSLFSAITGAVIGGGTGSVVGIVALLVIVSSGLVIVIRKRQI